MANRDLRITLRDKQTTGSNLPTDALYGEPFVQLYEGRLKFSGFTGGNFEESAESGTFEVGSKLYNSLIENRLSVNGNFIISGGTGLISTYGGATGAGIAGKFLSGTTDGFVLGNISDIQGVTDITRVQPGTNINTGGTANEPIVNVVDSPSFNDLSFSGTANGGNVIAGSITATTAFYSGSTNIEDIFLTSGDLSGATTVSAGSNVSVLQSGSDYEVSVVDSPSFNNISFSGTANGGIINADNITVTAATINNGNFDITGGGLIQSGGTDLYNIFVTEDINDITRVQPGTNIFTGGTANEPTINVESSPTFTGLVTATGFTDTSLTQGEVVYVGSGGRLASESGFQYDDVNNIFSSEKAVIGNSSLSGETNLTVYGNLLVVGESISAQTSDLYIEDNKIELNFNPTASTESTSIGAGWSIQDGSGNAGTDVFLDIRGTAVGLSNRSWSTNLEDIRIRETGTISSPNGSRVIAENDIIDAGSW